MVSSRHSKLSLIGGGGSGPSGSEQESNTAQNIMVSMPLYIVTPLSIKLLFLLLVDWRPVHQTKDSDGQHVCSEKRESVCAALSIPVYALKSYRNSTDYHRTVPIKLDIPSVTPADSTATP